MTPEVLDALSQLIEYAWKAEETDWEEKDKPGDHIFVQIKILDEWLKEVFEWALTQAEK
jgi:hypothetical protein